MTLQLPTVVRDPEVQQNLDAIARVLPASPPRILTVLPGKGTIGEQLIFKVETGVYWSLVYTGEATYPWAKTGGPPLRATGTNPSTASSTFQTAGAPAIPAPLAGEYDMRSEANLSNNTVEANTGRLGIFVEAVEYTSHAATMWGGGATEIGPTVRGLVTKGASVNERYRSESAKSATFFGMVLTIDPLRVG